MTAPLWMSSPLPSRQAGARQSAAVPVPLLRQAAARECMRAWPAARAAPSPALRKPEAAARLRLRAPHTSAVPACPPVPSTAAVVQPQPCPVLLLMLAARIHHHGITCVPLLRWRRAPACIPLRPLLFHVAPFCCVLPVATCCHQHTYLPVCCNVASAHVSAWTSRQALGQRGGRRA